MILVPSIWPLEIANAVLAGERAKRLQQPGDSALHGIAGASVAAAGFATASSRKPRGMRW